MFSYRSSHLWLKCRDSSVGVATSYGLNGRGSIPVRIKVLLFPITSRSALVRTQPPMQWVPGAVSLGLKRPGLEADHSPPCNAEDENGGAIPSLSHTFSFISTCGWIVNRYTLPKCDQVFYCLNKMGRIFLKSHPYFKYNCALTGCFS
jgi:hypothetical protein